MRGLRAFKLFEGFSPRELLKKEDQLRKLICLLFVFVSCLQLSAQTNTFLMRESGSILWNIGWADRFYIQHGSLQDLLSGNLIQDKVLRNATGPNPELWYLHQLSGPWSIGAVLKYQELKYQLVDTFAGSWIVEKKRLHADLHILSIGTRVQYELKSMKTYAGFDVGCLWGSLLTSTVDNIVGGDTSVVNVEGSRSGLVLGGSVGIVKQFLKGISVFLEGTFLERVNWKPWPTTAAYGRFDEKLTGWISRDRDLGFRALQLSLGVQIEAFSF